VGQNFEQHRIAKEGEKTCETCLSFDGSNCDSCDTTVGHTFKHNTCNYHLGEEKFARDTGILPIQRVSFNEERVAVCDSETPKIERCILSGIQFCMKCIRPLSQTES